MATLRERIQNGIKGPLEHALGKPGGNKKLKLVPVVGNGLTRIAAAIDEGKQTSWGDMVKNALAKIKKEESFDSLRLRGYELPEILSYAFSEAQENEENGSNPEREVWRQLREEVKDIQPSIIHDVLVKMSRDIITTNYDDLIEKAAKQLDRKHCAIDLPTETDCDKAENTGIIVYKLHGSMPCSEDSEFNEWLNGKKYEKTVTSAERYRTLGLASAQKFNKLFKKVVDLLEDKENIILFLGTGIASSELVLLRLLSTCESKHRLSLVVGSRIDPQLRLRQLGIYPVRVPIGLASSPERRALAHLIFLELLLPYLNAEEMPSTADIVDAIKKVPIDAKKQSGIVADLKPDVVSFGQLAVSRLIGMKEAIQQEKFHDAVKASVSPDGEKKVLFVDQVGGQACIPSLVWESLGLPCELVGEVGDDTLGTEIIKELGETKWLNFDDVEEIPTTRTNEVRPGFATEHFVCTTWFGVRTGFDAERYRDTRRRPNVGEVVKRHVNSPILYVTVPYWEAVSKALEDGKDSGFVILETGSNGKMEAEWWTAKQEGIILASIPSYLSWYAAEDAGDFTLAKRKSDRWWEKQRQELDLGDEYGRYRYLYAFLKYLESSDALFLKEGHGLLAKARAYLVTLGELGCVYWYRDDNEGWNGPYWCISESFEKKGEEKGVVLPMSEIRDALGCGDCGRAGFVYGLWKARKSTVNWRDWKDGKEQIHFAASFLNWFGLQKLRFFGLKPYLNFLRRNHGTPTFEKPLKNPLKFGENDWDKLIWQDAKQNGQLCSKIQEYREHFFESDKPKEGVIKELTKDWRNGLSPWG